MITLKNKFGNLFTVETKEEAKYWIGQGAIIIEEEKKEKKKSSK